MEYGTNAVRQNVGGELRLCADAEDVARTAADLFVELCAAAIAERGRFRVALSGGSTPWRAYELLAAPGRSSRIDWQRVDVFWGDERYVPADHPASNYRKTREVLLQNVPLPPANVHRVLTELSPPQAAASAYEEAVRNAFGESPGTPRFDLAFLGLGTNGHTASLFPASPLLHETTRLVAADFVEEVNMWRVTMTAPLLNAARTLAFLIAGQDKAQVLRDVLCGPPDIERLPAQLIHPADGTLLWILDHAASTLVWQRTA